MKISEVIDGYKIILDEIDFWKVCKDIKELINKEKLNSKEMISKDF